MERTRELGPSSQSLAFGVYPAVINLESFKTTRMYATLLIIGVLVSTRPASRFQSPKVYLIKVCIKDRGGCANRIFVKDHGGPK